MTITAKFKAGDYVRVVSSAHHYAPAWRGCVGQVEDRPNWRLLFLMCRGRIELMVVIDEDLEPATKDEYDEARVVGALVGPLEKP